MIWTFNRSDEQLRQNEHYLTIPILSKNNTDLDFNNLSSKKKAALTLNGYKERKNLPQQDDTLPDSKSMRKIFLSKRFY